MNSNVIPFRKPLTTEQKLEKKVERHLNRWPRGIEELKDK